MRFSGLEKEWAKAARFRIENRSRIPAHLNRLQIGRAGTGRQPRLIADVQPKHAQDKSCGLRRRFRRAFEGGQRAAFLPNVSRETSAAPPKLQVPPGQIFDRAARSARRSESETVREDEKNSSGIPNARPVSCAPETPAKPTELVPCMG